MLGTYLVKLSSNRVSDADSAEVTELLKMIGDFERISDHAVNILEAAKELNDKGISFSRKGLNEIRVYSEAVKEILDITMNAFENMDKETASSVEPLEDVIDDLNIVIKEKHIKAFMAEGKDEKTAARLAENAFFPYNRDRKSIHAQTAGALPDGIGRE